MKCFICGNNVKLPAGIKTEDVKSSGASTSLRTTPTLRAFGLSMSAYERDCVDKVRGRTDIADRLADVRSFGQCQACYAA
jgi:hypothetical protein